MAGSRPTFLKRQKERARQEKQRMKAERRVQRKNDKLTPAENEESNLQSPLPEEGPPISDQETQAPNDPADVNVVYFPERS